MSKFLIHIHSGPELKNKATLGMLVAITAFKKGDEVNMFLAADGTHLLNIKSVGEVIGPKTKTEMERLRFENRISDQTQVTEAGVENWQPFQSAIG